MQDRGVVFVTGDRLGDQLTALLEDAGCQVVRGPQPRPPRLKARMVRGKTIGLIGMGRTARGVVERLAGWDVQLQAHAPYVAQHEAPTPGDFGIKLTLWLRQEHSGVRQLERSVVYSLPATVVA